MIIWLIPSYQRIENFPGFIGLPVRYQIKKKGTATKIAVPL